MGLTNALPQYIRSQRERLKLTQLQLAQKSGVSDVFISRVERGQKKPGLGVLAAIGVALDCDVGYLRYLLWDAPDAIAGLSEDQWRAMVGFVKGLKSGK